MSARSRLVRREVAFDGTLCAELWKRPGSNRFSLRLGRRGRSARRRIVDRNSFATGDLHDLRNLIDVLYWAATEKPAGRRAMALARLYPRRVGGSVADYSSRLAARRC